MMHCSQKECKKKKDCYRFWLGENIKHSGFRYASFYYPEKPVAGSEYVMNETVVAPMNSGAAKRTIVCLRVSIISRAAPIRIRPDTTSLFNSA